MQKSKLQFKIQKLLIFVFLVTCHLLLVTSVNAQTPSTWQQSATGLKTSTNPNKLTGGLGLIVRDKGWPALMQRGGLFDNGYSRASGFVGLDLGVVKIPGATSSGILSEVSDWAHNEMTFNVSGTNSLLKVWSSRLSPATLLETNSASLRIFSGNIKPFTGNSVPVYPKYIAYSTTSGIQVKNLSITPVDLSTMDKKWILVWYGSNSPFKDTSTPVPYAFGRWGASSHYISAGLPTSAPYNYVYQADAPVLINFTNQPNSVVHSPEGGIDLNFSTSSGYSSIMPLFGRQNLKSSDTESWVSGLPVNVMSKINFWTQRSCDFPSTVSETYNYNSSTDTASFTEDLTFIPICPGGTKFASIPPVLSVAKNSLNVNFSAPLIDANTPTEFGPIFGVDNATSYTWSISGLNKYVNMSRNSVGSGQIPQDILNSLKLEVDKLTQAGHLAPWYFAPRSASSLDVGDLHFLNPAENLAIFSDVIPILPEPQKTNLINYLKSERTNYPPETVANLTLGQGVLRGDFNPPNQLIAGNPNILYSRLPVIRPELFMKRVWLYNFYGLSRYYDLTQEPIPSTVLAAAKSTLDQDMKEQDFATMYWFKGSADKYVAVQNANRHFAGLLGLIRISQKNADTATESLGRSLLAKAAVERVAQAQFPRYQYSSGLEVLPANKPAWDIEFDKVWQGRIFNYNWSTPQDDARQVTTVDQLGITLWDHSGFYQPSSGYWDDLLQYQLLAFAYAPYLVAFRDLVPETGQLLADFAKADADIYTQKLEALMPHWYSSFTAEGYLMAENNVASPVDSYQIFMAKSFIDKESPQNLGKYADIPFLSQGGDLYYVHKLAETSRAYAAEGAPGKKPGDIDGTPGVGIGDLSLLLSNWGNTNPGFNVDSDPGIGIGDLSLMLSNWGI